MAGLITEAWVRPTNPAVLIPGSFGKRLRQRYDCELDSANVLHCSASALRFEAYRSVLKSRNTWDPIIARNEWFQKKAIRHLKALCLRQPSKASPIVFAYSYAARGILRTARELGLPAILGQIDPGPAEESIVAEVSRRNGCPRTTNQRVPERYWELWREECDLCDKVVVNSLWSRDALLSEGVPAKKVIVVPLAYDPPKEARYFTRSYPRTFNFERPLRVLFLGSLNTRKGVYELLEATALLKNAPVEFWLVGKLGIPRSAIKENPRVRWLGSVDRMLTRQFYRQADVFILPTHSDGFAITQLEAMAWALPVIASKHCGEVVRHGYNGKLLSSVTADAIVGAIEACLFHGGALEQLSEGAKLTGHEFYSDKVVCRLIASAG